MNELEEFLNYIPSDGKTIGNKNLREKLKWDETKYWEIRNDLISQGIIRKSPGKGGAVSLVEIKTKEIKTLKSEKIELYKVERALYEPFIKTIKKIGKEEMGFDRFICQDTSSQGKRNTKGKWTRPDVVIVSISRFQFIPDQVFDIITYEIKLHVVDSITGVFETASHSRFATKSFLSIYIPEGWDEENQDLNRIKSECERFQIGLIFFTDPGNYDTWETKVEPERKNPDPSEMNQFITEQINEHNRKEIQLFIK